HGGYDGPTIGPHPPSKARMMAIIAQRVSIATGSARGIGHACAHALARRDQAIMLVDVRLPDMTRTRAAPVLTACHAAPRWVSDRPSRVRPASTRSIILWSARGRARQAGGRGESIPGWRPHDDRT